MSVIKIPSKNIYQKDNQKVVDNIITKVEVDSKEVLPNNEYDINVYNEDFDASVYSVGNISDKIDEKTTLKDTKMYLVSTYGSITPYYLNVHIKIPRKRLMSTISEIKVGVDDDGNANIKYSTICTKKTANISATYYRETNTSQEYFSNIYYSYPLDGETKIYELPQKLVVSKSSSAGTASSNYMTSSVTVVLDDKTNLKNVGVTVPITTDDDYYSFDCIVLCGEEIISLECKADNFNPISSPSFPASGQAIIYIPKYISITVYGNTIGINLQDKTISIGNGTDVMAFSGNELAQTTNVINGTNLSFPVEFTKASPVTEFTDDYYAVALEYDAQNIHIETNTHIIYDGETAVVISPQSDVGVVVSCPKGGKIALMPLGTKFIGIVTQNKVDGIYYNYINLIQDWQKGKETATLRCSIDDYRDNDTGELVISANGNDTLPMTFKIGDTVIPYVYGANGQDKPMSVNLDGTAKKFVVVGKHPIGDGAVWQELTLQEKTN